MIIGCLRPSIVLVSIIIKLDQYLVHAVAWLHYIDHPTSKKEKINKTVRIGGLLEAKKPQIIQVIPLHLARQPQCPLPIILL